MGCSPSKGHVKAAWADSGDVEGGKRKTEPANFSRTLRMKKYEWIAGMKLAVVDSVGGGLYDEDNRSVESLNSNSRRRVGGWVQDLPDEQDVREADCPPVALPGSTAAAARGGSGCPDTGSDCTPPSPVSSTNTLTLPLCELSTASSEGLLSPTRLHSRSQLHMLERSLSSAGSRVLPGKQSPLTNTTLTAGSPQSRVFGSPAPGVVSP